MGASYIEHKFDGKLSQQAVIAKMDTLQDDAIRENGTSYSGDLGSAPTGVEFSNKTFNTEDLASDYLSINQQKWEQPMAVRFRIPATGKQLDKLKKKKYDLGKLMSATQQHRTATASIGYAVAERIKTQSTNFKTCSECSSKVSSKHIKFSAKCPVCECSTGFFTEGDKKKVKVLQKKIDKVRADLDTVEDQIDNLAVDSTDTDWLVGCWCSE